jgi:hypothetical protein
MPRAVQQSGSVALLPREEIEANSTLYSILKKANDVQFESARAIEEAERYDLSDADPSHLSPRQIDTEIQLTQDALTLIYLRGALLRNLQGAFPDFPATLTAQELPKMRHAPEQPTTALLAPARAITMERLVTSTQSTASGQIGTTRTWGRVQSSTTADR